MSFLSLSGEDACDDPAVLGIGRMKSVWKGFDIAVVRGTKGFSKQENDLSLSKERSQRVQHISKSVKRTGIVKTVS